MKKYLVGFLLSLGIANAGLVNGVAVVVNDEPITLYDIDLKMQEKGLNKNDAVKNLIEEVLYEQQIAKENISVDIFEVDEYISKLAAQNRMSLLEFKSVIRQQQDYQQFVNDIKKRLTHQELVKKVARGNIKVATENDIKIYYENNQQQFTFAENIDVIAYVSKSKEALAKIQNGGKADKNLVKTQSITFKNSELTPKVRFILNNTGVNQFSNIFAQSGNYNLFLVKNKSDIQTLPITAVKEKIFQVIMQKREQDYLEEYFETLKITADIKVYR
jgi:hypothetical protein